MKCFNCGRKIEDEYQNEGNEVICETCYDLAMNKGDKKIKQIREVLPVSDGFVSWNDIAIMIIKIKKIIN